VKQYGVSDFTRFTPKSPITLMTPEPGAGVYKNSGAEVFVRRFGYEDKSGKPDRINFGGIYSCVKEYHADTGLRMSLDGYDSISGKMTDIDGGIRLVDQHKEIAAEWKFKAMMEHWNRKHSQAAYVPSLMRTPPPEYAYGAQVLLCEQTDFMLFLKAFASGVVYYDPAIKLENASQAKPDIKRRSQFRVKHNHITQMYHRHEVVDLTII
jgi:MvaI/BcnI restriction endonuclease family